MELFEDYMSKKWEGIHQRIKDLLDNVPGYREYQKQYEVDIYSVSDEANRSFKLYNKLRVLEKKESVAKTLNYYREAFSDKSLNIDSFALNFLQFDLDPKGFKQYLDYPNSDVTDLLKEIIGFQETLEKEYTQKYGLKRISPKPGDTFDFNSHQELYADFETSLSKPELDGKIAGTVIDGWEFDGKITKAWVGRHRAGGDVNLSPDDLELNLRRTPTPGKPDLNFPAPKPMELFQNTLGSVPGDDYSSGGQFWEVTPNGPGGASESVTLYRGGKDLKFNANRTTISGGGDSGLGLWMTPVRETAEAYSKTEAGRNVSELEVSFKGLLDLDNLNPNQISDLKARFPGSDKFLPGGPEYEKWGGKVFLQHITESREYVSSNEVLGKNLVNRMLRVGGYDGITFVDSRASMDSKLGGPRAPEGGQRVYVVLDPKAVKSSKIISEAAPEPKVPPKVDKPKATEPQPKVNKPKAAKKKERAALKATQQVNQSSGAAQEIVPPARPEPVADKVPEPEAPPKVDKPETKPLQTESQGGGKKPPPPPRPAAKNNPPEPDPEKVVPPKKTAPKHTKVVDPKVKAAVNSGNEFFDVLVRNKKKIGLGLAAVGLAMGYKAISESGQEKGNVSRSKKGRSGSDYLLATGAGAAAGFFAQTQGKGFFAPFLVGSALAGIALDSSKGQTISSSLATAGIAAATSIAAYSAVHSYGGTFLQSFNNFLEYFATASKISNGVGGVIRENPAISSILRKGNLAIAAGVIAMPIAHQYAQRKLARKRRRGREGQDVMATIKADNQAGRPSPRQGGDVAGLIRPKVQYRSTGQIRTSSNFDLNGLGL